MEEGVRELASDLISDFLPNGEVELGHEFAVHTPDFADGVWCLDIDAKLDLTNGAGSLAVGGDRLYVASVNGWVGSFLIPSITDPGQSPTMDWTTQIAAPGPDAPVITADDDGVYISTNNNNELVHRRPDRTAGSTIRLPGTNPQALATTPDGELVAIGEDWTTLTSDFHRPEWLNNISQLIVAPTPS